MINALTIKGKLDEVDTKWRTTLNNLPEGDPARVSAQASSAWGNPRKSGKGITVPSLENISAIADYYGVSVGYLLGEVDRADDERRAFDEVLRYLECLDRVPGCSISLKPDGDDKSDLKSYEAIHISAIHSLGEVPDIDEIAKYLTQARMIRAMPFSDEEQEDLVKHIRDKIVNKHISTKPAKLNRVPL